MSLPRLALLTDDRTVAMLATRALAEDFDVRAFQSDVRDLAVAVGEFGPAVVVLRGLLALGPATKVMRALRADTVLSATPMVVLSGDAEGSDAAIAAGAAAFVPMPFAGDHLRDTVLRVTQKARTILYVEDSRAQHKVVVPRLLEDGYTVFEAFDGREALALLQGGLRPDLVLSDVDMPELDGLRLCEAIKADEALREIPVVLLTARDSDEAVHAGFAVGADDYMMKPVVIPEMLSRIARFLGASVAQRSERVLVVDSDAAAALLLVRTLATHGLSCERADEAEAARNLLESGRFALAIVACDLPATDGVTLVRQLRDTAETRALPIIMTSESNSLTEQVRVRSVGPQSFLVKPISPDRLLAEVERTLATARQRRQVAAMQGYLSDGAIEAIVRRSTAGDAAPRANAALRTIFFLDIVGFTTLCEALAPQAVVHFLNSFFDVVVAVLVKHGASVDKFIGDCVMALFPRAKSGPRRAAAAALEILSLLPELRTSTGIDVHVRIGINAGQVVLGDIGSALHRRDFTVIGDNVNVAARLQSSAGIDEIFISDSVAAQLDDTFDVASVGLLSVKGRREPIRAFRVCGWTEGPSSAPPSDLE